MEMTRREFVVRFGAGAAAASLSGCMSPSPRKEKAKIALQLYSLYKYIGGEEDAKGAIVKPGVGFEKAFRALSAIGYRGVEFCDYYGQDARTIRSMLRDNGLEAVGAHVGGWRQIEGDKLKEVAEFQLELGNNILICPGGTGPDGMDWKNPKWDARCAEHMKFITEFFNERAEAAAKLGCRVGIHNHQWEFQLRDEDGVSFWDHFFSSTSQDVLMEQDVGWTTCAGCDPCKEFLKYPGRSPLIHAKENGMGVGVTSFDGVLGRPGKPGARPVDWDALIPVAEDNGTGWFVVECERHFDDLSAVMPSCGFLQSKGLN